MFEEAHQDSSQVGKQVGVGQNEVTSGGTVAIRYIGGGGGPGENCW